jgi:hypothetical protein
MKFTLKRSNFAWQWDAEENNQIVFCSDILQKLGVVAETPETRYLLQVRKTPKVGFTRIKLERSRPKSAGYGIYHWAIPSIEVDEYEALVFPGVAIDQIIDKLLTRKIGSLYFKFTKI